MKTVFVLRHGAAEDDGSAPTDFARRLGPHGQQQALAIGAIMGEYRLEFDAVIASPALRVVETVSGVRDGARHALEPTYDPRAYNASPDTLVEIIREADDRFQRILLVGHNPGLQILLLHLAESDGDGHYRSVAASYPTAALAELRLAVDRWRDVGPRCGRIVSLVRPDDAAFAPARRD